MDDLISRQAAIDLVKSFYKIDKSVLKIMVFKLKQLPSVQPEFSNNSKLENNSKELENKNGELTSRQDAIDALKICDNNEDGINCHKCPLRDERWDGAWQDNETNCYRKLMRDSAKLLELPSVQPRKGTWDYTDDMYETYKCSECGFNTDDYIEYNFCPNCGCRMEEGE